MATGEVSKSFPPPSEVDPKKWTPEEKKRMKRLTKAAYHLWRLVLFGGGDYPIEAIIKKKSKIE